MSEFLLVTLVCCAAMSVVGAWILGVLAAGGQRRMTYNALMLAVAIALGRIWWVAQFGSQTPYWDQWNGEYGNLLRPWQDGALSWDYLLAPHNEHRILFTRLEALGLVMLTGIWDPVQQMLLNAFLHGFAVSLCWVICAARLPPTSAMGVGVVAFLAAITPAAHENILAGFQSQFSYCLLFSAAGMVSLVRGLENWRWLIPSTISLGLALVTLGGGVLATIAGIALVVVYMVVKWPNGFRRLAPPLMILMAVALAGVLALHHVDHHDALKSHSIRDFLGSFFKCLAWPGSRVGCSLVMWAPSLMLLWRLLRRDSFPKYGTLTILSGWVLLQAAAIAYARGAGGAGPAGRYVDLLAIGVIINASACAILMHESQRPFWRWGTLAWALCGLLWYLQIGDRGWNDIRKMQNLQERHTEVVREYLSGKRQGFEGLRPFQDLPFPSIEYLTMCLSNPSIRGLLPSLAGVQDRVDLQNGSGHGFAYPGHYPDGPMPTARSWGSWSPLLGDAQIGEWLSPGFQTSSGWIAFQICGYPGRDGMGIEILRDGHDPVKLDLGEDPRESWRAVTLQVGVGSYRLRLVDNNPTTWLSITSPYEVTRWDRSLTMLRTHPRNLLWLSLSMMLLFSFLFDRWPASSRPRNDQ
jgi:hypothetical protein